LAVAPLVAQPTAASSDAAAKLAELLDEREATLKKLLEALQRRSEVGHATTEDVIQASIQLLKAQLDRAPTKDKRIDLHEKIVDNYRKAEDVARIRQREAQVPVDAVLKAKAKRLRAEIRLWRIQLEG
jgi:hypothetical protein